MFRSILPLAVALAAAPACAEAPPPAAAKTFPVPAGSRPHDVAPAPDGRVWYTAQGSGKLGILDPKTGAVEEVPLGTGSAPHGVIQGPDKAAWITDGGQNAIVRVDPNTKAVKVWPLPAEFPSANLNTAAFDGRGRIWFTGQAGVYGRLDPRTGKMDVWRDPAGRGPYGIAATPDGQIYYVSLAGSHLARVDLDSGVATVIEPPTPNQGARRVWSDSKGNLWISEWAGGQLSRYTPATGAWKSWKPEGERPRVYAVWVDPSDLVWISDFGANAVLSFDPKTERWTRYPGSAANSNVRQILGTARAVYLPESGLDRIMIVEKKAK